MFAIPAGAKLRAEAEASQVERERLRERDAARERDGKRERERKREIP